MHLRKLHCPSPWLLLVAAFCIGLSAGPVAASNHTDEQTAASLADLLRAARGVISAHQDLINDPSSGDKGLTGAVVLTEALARYRSTTGEDVTVVDETTRYGRTITALKTAVVQVIDEHQSTINMPGVGFKGFIPAAFARLVNERFGEIMQGEAAMKVTAPRNLVRNRKALPDAWEEEIIGTKLMSADWPKGEPYMTSAEIKGRDAFRFLVPEYYQSSCLQCHGKPKGELDITGYPKEGGEEGDLGGVISVTLYH